VSPPRPDDRAGEWKYIPVRRLEVFIEEMIYQRNKWAVFEPNDEPLGVTQSDIVSGSFIMVIPLAPIKPAEFVVIRT
jgi:phage tail sheath protein FI